MLNRLTPIVLVLGGLILVLVGALVTFTPQTMFEPNGIDIGADPNLLSEIRAPGGLLLVSGLIITLGGFKQSLRTFALSLSVLVYLSYGLTRVWSVIVDGAPAASIQGALAIELVVGLISLLCLRQATRAS